MTQKVKNVIFFFISSLSRSTRHLTLDTCLFSLDHSVRSRQNIRWDRQTNLIRRLEINDQLKLHRLLDREIGRLGALENFIDVAGGAPEQIGEASPIRNEATNFHGLS